MNATRPLILIVDDDKDNLGYLERIMRRQGYEVLLAESGQKALTLFAEAMPDLVLLDVMMPNMDGFETCQRLQQDSPTASDTPIVMISSLNDSKSIERALALGAVDFITKPIPVGVLERRVSFLMEARHTQRQLVRQIEQLHSLNAISRVAIASPEIDSILPEIAQLSAQALQVPATFIYDFDSLGKTANILAQYLDPTFEDHCQRNGDIAPCYDLSQHSTLADWMSKPSPYSIFEPAMLPDFEREFYTRYALHYVAWVPISLDEEVFGFITFWETRRERVFSASDRELLEGIALQIQSGIQNARLFATIRQSRQQLLNYTRELETRNRELDDYGHTIAHGLKTPLNTILNHALYLSEVEAEALSEEAQDSLALIIRRTEGMANMIDQLLLLAAARQKDKALHPLHPSAILQGVIAQFQAQIVAKGITLSVQDSIPPVLGLTVYLEEVFANLLSNAIKYIGTDNPAPHIRIRWQALAEMIWFAVEDNGIGIDAELREHLFEMFWRGRHETIDGTGLGLSIVSRLVSAMRGTLGVEALPTGGSRFWFTLRSADTLPNADSPANSANSG